MLAELVGVGRGNEVLNCVYERDDAMKEGWQEGQEESLRLFGSSRV